MTPRRLKEQMLPPEADNIYVRAMMGGDLVGNVFGTRWVHVGRPVLWITQLCVSQKYRNQGIAKQLLQCLRQDEAIVGVLSSHPFAISAVLRIFGDGVEGVDLETVKQCRAVMTTCPVRYVNEATLHGALFEDQAGDGSVSCADTKFWVDHQEPLEALKAIKEKGFVWPFGQLPNGHEFLALVKRKA
jgi:hypothetical protein